MAFTLPEKKVTVKPNLENPGWIKNPKHLAFFKVEGAYESYPITMDRNGRFRNPFTKDEKEYLEKVMDTELSVYKKDGYIRKRNVRLTRDPKELDLSNPEDYIDYKILLTATDKIAPSVKNKKDKHTYKFYIEDAADLATLKNESTSLVMSAWIAYGKIQEDRTKLVNFLKVYNTATRKPAARMGADTKLDFIQSQVTSIVENDMKSFLEVVNNPNFDTMLLIAEGIETGVIKRSGTKYLLADGDPLGNTFKEAIDYLKAPVNQELALTISEKIKLKQ